ncbi:cell division ATP-binding protein FtsE [Tamilnaduibacter salinus]|uniref:Cell division ATP-binding protein FtsE n=1 Tax=Tamilnaduibacter salinus TaxID=1484056 RepID=A0A2A2HZQ4_9GAMM|nr:cell division ATP-binding protein FtsE [Tamilnaduibacter salinus]PAV24822.1 cell division ATP-binding protein FtsE [Tamilnaduibacter salinus]PVY77644.1 cell division ATP-binding protein FtsE [Tamilnaduibacter salinus]
MIEFDRVSKRYDGGYTALKGVSFAMDRGEMAFLTGHSGAGKSTLLKLMTVMERPSAGNVLVGGQALNRLRPRQVPFLRRHIGVVFQNHQLLFDRTVFDNVAMPLEVIGAPPGEIGRRVRAALDKVGLLNKERMNPIALSGGEQQRVGIARAVVNKPPLLLADEPTGNLDPELSADIMQLFEQFSQVGVTVLVASHDAELVRAMGNRVLTLREGELVSGGASPREQLHGH